MQVSVCIIAHRHIAISLCQVHIFLLSAIHLDASPSSGSFFPSGTTVSNFQDVHLHSGRSGVSEQFGLLFFLTLFFSLSFLRCCLSRIRFAWQSLMMKSTAFELICNTVVKSLYSSILENYTLIFTFYNWNICNILNCSGW